MTATSVSGVELFGPEVDRADEILATEAVEFVALLHREFDPRREELLAARRKRQERIDAGGTLDFLDATREIREGDWQVAPAPPALQDRRVEITGPIDRKMVINALNSGARGFMADFEDSNSPTWRNLIEGQANLIDAIERTIEFTSPEGKEYRLNEETATLLVRPRGWHLTDKHLCVDGHPISGSLLDFGLFLFHNARRLLDKGAGPVLLPPQDGEPSRGAPVERRVRPRRGRARARRAARSAPPSSSRRSPPPSRWRRSSTSCASTRRG